MKPEELLLAGDAPIFDDWYDRAAGREHRRAVRARCKRHEPACRCQIDDVFVCTWCERETGHCQGACDSTPGLCNDCHNTAYALWEGLDEFAGTGAQP